MLITALPYPLPGECLYSLFCRYHVRSGNPSEKLTNLDLFGQSTIALSSSITTPTLVYMARRWNIQEMGMTIRNLANNHSAIQYYSIGMDTNELKKHQKAIYIGERRKKLIALKNKQILSKCGKLRFCPACAKIEKEVYGEAYWHTANQLEGVEICPIHKIILCESDVTIARANRHYFPANSTIINNSLNEVSSHRNEELIGVAKDIFWLSKYGKNLGSCELLIHNYLKDPDVHIALKLIDKICILSNVISDQSNENNLKTIFNLFTPLNHALYMHYRYGGINIFWKEYYN